MICQKGGSRRGFDLGCFLDLDDQRFRGLSGQGIEGRPFGALGLSKLFREDVELKVWEWMELRQRRKYSFFVILLTWFRTAPDEKFRTQLKWFFDLD